MKLLIAKFAILFIFTSLLVAAMLCTFFPPALGM